MIRILKNLMPAGWIVTGVGALLLCFLIYKGINAILVAPAVSKAVKPLNTAIYALKADTTQLNEALRWQIKENALYADSISTERIEFSKRIESLQLVVKQVEDRRKFEVAKLTTENANLRTGVRVDLWVVQKKLFKTDTTKVEGWKWGY